MLPITKRRRTSRALLGALVLFLFLMIGAWFVFFAVPQRGAAMQAFTIPLRADASSALSSLRAQGFITYDIALEISLFLHGRSLSALSPGGYELSKSMSPWQIAGVFARGPSSIWIVIPEGFRKEQIADILAQALGWSGSDRQEWAAATSADPDYAEGVYFPDSYLIPIDESPADIAQRLRAHFEEVFAPYATEAAAQDIKWTTALKIASLIQREAAGADDMPLISGIIWNRLEAGMALDIDATLQYVTGKEGNWWPAVDPADKSIDSPYNTYKYKGLPPTPIDEPGLDAIKAAIAPQATDCYYYLHDADGVIHCSATYAGQIANIDTYLR